MKQIFCGSLRGAGKRRGRWAAGLAGAILLGLAAAGGAGEEGEYLFAGPPGPSGERREERLSLAELAAGGGREMASPYFDRAMGYRGSRFHALDFAALVKKYDPEGRSDAVLLDCFDDYQGLLPVEDIRRYRLALATRIDIAGGNEVPGWLRPLLVLVPEGGDAPRKERFLTANIRAVRFVRLRDYYAPLEALAAGEPGARAGLGSYTDNCLFCHPLAGVGGGKGGPLGARHDFSTDAGRRRFYQAFLATHREDNPDKQNIEQFVDAEALANIAALLSRAGAAGG